MKIVGTRGELNEFFNNSVHPELENSCYDIDIILNELNGYLGKFIGIPIYLVEELEESEIIKCKNCIHLTPFLKNQKKCEILAWCPSENDYCSMAERKER